MDNIEQKKRLGIRIKLRRIELGLTQEELAARLGNKSRASVCTVENGKEDMTTARIQQYANALECSLYYLIGDEGLDPEIKQTLIESGLKERAKYERHMAYAERLYHAYTSASPDTQAAVRAILHLSEDGQNGDS